MMPAALTPTGRMRPRVHEPAQVEQENAKPRERQLRGVPATAARESPARLGGRTGLRESVQRKRPWRDPYSLEPSPARSCAKGLSLPGARRFFLRALSAAWLAFPELARPLRQERSYRL